jgi:dihydrofolate reductase
LIRPPPWCWGRVTYEAFAAFWPQQTDDVPFATLNNTIKKLVVSETLQSAEWQNTSVISDADMQELKAKGDGAFHITGSGTLVRNCLPAPGEVILAHPRIRQCP